MAQVTIHEAKTHLSRLIQRALEGEEIVIAKGDQPLVRLTALEPQRIERRLGRFPGMIKRLDSDFFETPADFDPYTR